MDSGRSSPPAFESELSAIVATSGDAIIGKRLDGTVTSWNRAAQLMYGYTAEEMIGRSIELLEPEERRGEIRELLARVKAGEQVVELDTVRRRRDGSLVPVLVTVSPIKDSEGNLTGASTIAHDLTRRRALDAALRQSQEELRQTQKLEAIGRLAGGIAHDFNNLLVVIRGYSTMLLERLEGEELHAVEQIAAAAERATLFTRQLLAFSRRQALRPEPIDLNDVVRGTLVLLERAIGDHVRIETDLDPSIGTVLGDRSELTNALINLAINARDAMPDGGLLRFRTQGVRLDDVAHVLLEVSDTGIGMDDETREHAFDPFFTTKEDGTGLGLATVFALVKQSGGRVDLRSEAGAGTTLSLWLPVTHEQPAAGPPAASTEPVHGDEVILIVEDADLVRELVVDTLESYGYRVLAATRGEEALDLVEGHEGPIDLVLTDVVMPGMNGRDLAERLVVLRPAMKVLFTSGYAGDVALRGSTLVGAGFIEKPYLPEELGRAIRRLLAA